MALLLTLRPAVQKQLDLVAIGVHLYGFRVRVHIARRPVAQQWLPHRWRNRLITGVDRGLFARSDSPHHMNTGFDGPPALSFQPPYMRSAGTIQQPERPADCRPRAGLPQVVKP